MQIEGVSVNVEAIAEGMLALCERLPESYRNAMAFGMLPAPLMDRLDVLVREKGASLGLAGDGLERFKTETVRQVTHAMYARMKMVV